jgi:hypothetical protein
MLEQTVWNIYWISGTPPDYRFTYKLTLSRQWRQRQRRRDQLRRNMRSLTAPRITGFLDFVHGSGFWMLGNKMFRKLDLFPTSCDGRETLTVFGPLKRANLNQWLKSSFQRLRLAFSMGPNRISVSFPHLRTETNPVFETLCFLVFRIPDDGHSPETQ